MGLGMSRSKRGDTQIVKFPSSLLILLSAVSLMGVLPVAASGQQPGDAAQSSSNQPAPQHQPVPSQQAPPSKDNQREDPGKSKNSDKIEPEGVSKDRLFYALPNFLTLENAGQVPPLSSKEKFKVVAKGSFDYVQIPWYAFLAGTTLILGAAYTLWLVKRVIFGGIANDHVRGLKDLNGREFLVLSLLAAAVLIVGIWPAPLLDVMRATMQHLSEQLLMSKIVP